jgi:phosphopantothenoylcysteine synthetase/decarboxylase
MRVLVTSGGTREPVDDVRVLTNSSTGRLGARLADVFAESGYDVHLLHGQGAAQPRAVVTRQVFNDSTQLADLLEKHVPGATVVLHAAAVADFIPDPVSGKISSEQDELVLVLRRAPKLIDRLRELAPEALLIGFKLTASRTLEERLALSRALLSRARLDLVVSNEMARVDEHDHEVLLVGPEQYEGHGGGKSAVSWAILRSVEEFLSKDVRPT